MKEQFLAAVAASPDDDAPRLIYADWLEENGESERAEFIRIQCRIAAPWSEDSGECWPCNCRRNNRQHTNGPCRCSAGWKALRSRQIHLVFNHGYSWLGIASQYVTIDEYWTRHFKRGFLDSIYLPSADWLRDGPAIAREHPVIREARFTDWEAQQSFTAPPGNGSRWLLYHGFRMPWEEIPKILRSVLLNPAYKNEAAAWIALSHAALDYAQQQNAALVTG